MIRPAVVAFVACFALASCGNGGGADEPKTTVPSAPTSSSTTTTTTVTYEVPPTIDAPYIAKVMAALDHLSGEAARHLAHTRVVDEEFNRYLVAAYGGESFDLERRLWGEVLSDDLRLLRPEPGDPETAVERVLVAEPGCVIFQGNRDYFKVFNEPDAPGPPKFVGLVPIPPDRDIRHFNPTPWVITFDGRRSDGSQPSKDVACTEP
ncbi:MAG TPA: hypothetical protein VHM89_15165 [Acidimicrobiales bacterium]|nr:hypothetical protein [Acidimicrobiales bacterium]